METTEKKKHKGGYELLKEKYAKLEAHAEELQKDLDFALEKAKKERDAMKTRNNELCDVYHSLSMEYNNQYKRIRWLLDHASWFTLRKYRKQFEKGEI